MLRSDRDRVLSQGPQAVFEHYRRQLPTLATLLEGSKILKAYYPNHNPYGVRKNFRRFARQVTGDGWLLIGDAAFFLDPLRSLNPSRWQDCIKTCLPKTLTRITMIYSLLALSIFS